MDSSPLQASRALASVSTAHVYTASNNYTASAAFSKALRGLNGQRTVPQSELEYVRSFEHTFNLCRGWIGASGDKSVLIFFNEWLYFVPSSDIVEFRVWRTLPAKGPGCARLCVECRGDLRRQQTKSLTLAEAAGADDLSDLASAVAVAFDKPLVLTPYDHDV